MNISLYVMTQVLIKKKNSHILLTNTRDSISRVSRMTGTVERSLGVGAVRINMAVVFVVFVMRRKSV